MIRVFGKNTIITTVADYVPSPLLKAAYGCSYAYPKVSSEQGLLYFIGRRGPKLAFRERQVKGRKKPLKQRHRH